MKTFDPDDIKNTDLTPELSNLGYLWAGLCILGAVFFIVRQRLFGL